MNLSDVLGKASRPRKDVKLCFAGGLVEDYRAASKAADSEDSLAAPHAKVLADLQAQIEALTVTLTIEAMPSAEWGRLIDAHPPSSEKQEPIGFDPSTFYQAAVKRCLVNVSDEEFDQLMGTVNDAQFDSLAAAVQQVNRSTPDVDFTSSGSGKTDRSGQK